MRQWAAATTPLLTSSATTLQVHELPYQVFHVKFNLTLTTELPAAMFLASSCAETLVNSYLIATYSQNLQMLMSVPWAWMTVISMLSVPTLRMVLHVLVRVAILEMELIVQVSHFSFITSNQL